MKKGEPVKKTGPDKDLLDKATKALATKLPGAKDSQQSEKPNHGLRATDIESHFDGSHTVRHTPHEGEQISYAVQNTGELVKKIEQYLSGKGESLPAEDRQVPAPEQSPVNGIGG